MRHFLISVIQICLKSLKIVQYIIISNPLMNQKEIYRRETFSLLGITQVQIYILYNHAAGPPVSLSIHECQLLLLLIFSNKESKKKIKKNISSFVVVVVQREIPIGHIRSYIHTLDWLAAAAAAVFFHPGVCVCILMRNILRRRRRRTRLESSDGTRHYRLSFCAGTPSEVSGDQERK